MKSFAVVVPWTSESQMASFKRAWNIGTVPDWLLLRQDEDKIGCGAMKNKLVREATDLGAEVVVVLDDDCYPTEGTVSLESFAVAHMAALEPQAVEMFAAVTSPPSRGTPYAETKVEMAVAASMGFWSTVGDYCAVRQLAENCAPMKFKRQAIFSQYFPLSGMNLAFEPRRWMPWCQFIDVPRFDDIWMGWLWQREAYHRRCCFNLRGPTVHHSRQSNVWKNLEQEARYLRQSETLWREIALHQRGDYDSLRALLPV